MSPLTLEKIKKAKGRVRIHSVIDESRSTGVVRYAIQVDSNGVWETIYEDHNRQICENMVRKASNRVILG